MAGGADCVRVCGIGKKVLDGGGWWGFGKVRGLNVTRGGAVCASGWGCWDWPKVTRGAVR